MPRVRVSSSSTSIGPAAGRVSKPQHASVMLATGPRLAFSSYLPGVETWSVLKEAWSWQQHHG